VTKLSDVLDAYRGTLCFIADDRYKDSRNVIAVNREYAALKENVARLTAEWEGLVSEAERIEADYRREREELAG
jgi:hypothetical protein